MIHDRKKILTLFPGISASVPIQNLGQREGHYLEGGHLLRNYQTIKDINKFTLYPYYSRKRGRRVETLTQGGHLFDILPKGWVLIRGRLLFDHGHLFKGGACLTIWL